MNLNFDQISIKMTVTKFTNPSTDSDSDHHHLITPPPSTSSSCLIIKLTNIHIQPSYSISDLLPNSLTLIPQLLSSTFPLTHLLLHLSLFSTLTLRPSSTVVNLIQNHEHQTSLYIPRSSSLLLLHQSHNPWKIITNICLPIAPGLVCASVYRHPLPFYAPRPPPASPTPTRFSVPARRRCRHAG